MGKGICSRRQRRFFQSFLLLLFICGTVCALMISYEMHRELKKTEATALQYQQHQESLSAQLQGKALHSLHQSLVFLMTNAQQITKLFVNTPYCSFHHVIWLIVNLL